MNMENTIQISVRNLVEHVFMSGDIETGLRFASTLTEGTRIHQQHQKSFPESSEKEKYVQTEISIDDLVFKIDGRMDGLHFQEEKIIVEEIKSTSLQLNKLEEDTYQVHWAQAFFYAYIYTHDHEINQITIQLTYVQKQTGQVLSFFKEKTSSELKNFVYGVLYQYAPYARLMINNKQKRNESAKKLTFPFPHYRKGQRNLAGVVYTTLRDSKNIFVEAPTGIGKTISTTFPAVKAIGEGLVERIIYTTARNTTRELAEEAFKKLEANGLNIRTLSLTAKDKICFKDEGICNPEHCEFAKGHYDRLNGAIIDILDNESIMTRSVIENYARKHRLCPFELSIDVAYNADAIICDYNYIFDPQVSLKRLFDEQKKKTVLLIDEAHNLVDRAREMYSATILKSHFLQLKREYPKNTDIHLTAKKINDFLLQVRKEIDGKDETVLKDIPSDLITLVEQFIEASEKALRESENVSNTGLVDIYYEAQAFLRTAKLFDERFVILVEVARSEVSMKLFCLDPSHLLNQMGKKYRTKVYFSATLSPVSYYMDMLGGSDEDLTLSLPSPFLPEQTDVYISPLSTRYRDREQTRERIAFLLENLMSNRHGNYLMFFPSYQYMNMVYDSFLDIVEDKFDTMIQKPNMTENERESFLSAFDVENPKPFVCFAVMGGIFSEGIDLVGDRLNGVVVVGVGIPQIGLERNIIKDYFTSIGKNGYDYAYVYPGINKVLQAGGRLIRSENDAGTILLIDDRFLTNMYQELLPDLWKKFTIIK